MLSPSRVAVLLGVVGLVPLALADHLTPAPGISISDGSGAQSPDLGYASKPKIQRLSNGVIVAVWGDGAGDTVYDVKADAERPARDIFARTCNSKTQDCTLPESWTAAVNLSQTASRSSIETRWRGPNEDAAPYAGDSDKPNIFKLGSNVVVTWVDAYCPGDAQGTVSYVELDDREVPYHCVYVARSTDGGNHWQTAQQLTDGRRDAKGDTHRASNNAWAVVWQEDPAGLQLGSAEGPGDGASGANVTNGTDIWYSALSYDDFAAGLTFPEPVRLTDNFTHMERHEGAETGIESGVAGASRPNVFVVGNTVQLAYEETKGSGGADSGKVIRYHAFDYRHPPTSCEADSSEEDGCARASNGEVLPALDDPERMGCVLSDPRENGRRVRFFTQGTPGTNSGARFFVFWKQGPYDEGGPSDIIARRGVAPSDDSDPMKGLRPQDLEPAVAVPTDGQADGCHVIGDEDEGTGAFGNTAGWNMSADTEEGGDLGAATTDNDYEDARAHRGVIAGDFIALGWSYTPDWAIARYTDQENYEFWIRTSTDGGATWTEPVDISSETTRGLAEAMGLEPEGVNVKEPRIVKTPGHGPGCPSGDPGAEDTTDVTDCSASQTFIVAFGTETNVYEMQGGSQELDLYVLRSTDRGASYEPVAVLSAAEADEGESQLQLTPDGEHVYATWFAHDELGTEAMFTALEVEDGHDTGEPTDDTGADDTGTTADDSDAPDDSDDVGHLDDTGVGGGESKCSCAAGASPSNLGLLALLGALVGWRRRRGGVASLRRR